MFTCDTGSASIKRKPGTYIRLDSIVSVDSDGEGLVDFGGYPAGDGVGLIIEFSLIAAEVLIVDDNGG